MTELSNLTDEQRQLLALLLSEQDSSARVSEGTTPSIPRRTQANQAPLSAAQQRMWLAYRQAPTEASYNIQTALRVTGQLNTYALKQALLQLITRHETLRTSFALNGLEPVQMIHVLRAAELTELQITEPDALREFVRREALRPWDLNQKQSLRATLITCARDDYVLLLGMHHILSDGWSVGILHRELWQLYEACASNRVQPLPALVTQYADYAQWEQDTSAATYQVHLDFWRKKLTDVLDEASLPLDHERQTKAAGEATIYSWSLPLALTDSVHRLAQVNASSTFAVCLAAFYLLLSELSGNRDVLVASPVANRERAELEPLVGYFANTVVLRAEWSLSTTFNDLVRQVHDYSLEVLDHQSFPFERIIEELNPRRMNGVNPLTQVFFAFQKYALDVVQARGLHISEFEHSSRSTSFDLECHVWETPQAGISATFIYPPLFDTQTVTDWAARWGELLAQACAQPAQPLSAWRQHQLRAEPKTPPAEIYARLEALARQQPSVTAAIVHVASRQVEIEYLSPEELYRPRPTSLKKAEGQAVVSPPTQRSERPAFIDGGPLLSDEMVPATLPELLIHAAREAPSSGCLFLPSETRLSYLELLTQAKQIQTWLQQSGVLPGSKVLFQLEAEQDVIRYFWGTVFAGAVPIIQPLATLRQPQAAEQVLAVWKLSHQPLVLVTSQTAAYWQQNSVPLLNAEQADFQGLAQAPSPHCAQPDDIALLAHSSGSTGNPKGIPLSHRNLLVRALAARDLTQIDSSTVMLNWMPLNHHAPISDWHLRGVAAASHLIYGHTATVLANPLLWLDWLEKYQVTDTWAPNFAYALIIETLEEPANASRLWTFERLRTCLCAGESIIAGVMDRFEDMLAPSKFARGVLQPAYGLTENASGITYHLPVLGARIRRHYIVGEHHPFVSCGTPLAGVLMRVVNDQGTLLQECEIGHLQMRGACIFKGYLEANDLHKERFWPDDWFDSGDLGFIFNGEVYITGREKAEIIVNGRNLSCEALEITIGELPDIRRGKVAVCAVRPSEALKEQIAIFFVPTQASKSSELLRTLRGFVVEQYGILPDYLIPVESDAIPRTDLGKIRHDILVKQFLNRDFDAILQTQAAHNSTIPNCFFSPDWRRAVLRSTGQMPLDLHVLAGQSALAHTLVTQLTKNGHHVHLLTQLPEIPTGPLNLIDLSLFDPVIAAHDAQRPRVVVEHLRALLQNLAALAPKKCFYTVVTCHAQPTGRETELRYDDGVLAGLLKSVAQEFSAWLECRHIDLSPASTQELADLLIDEIQSDDFAPEVAYRQKRRLVPYLRPVTLRPQPEQAATPFSQAGFVAISGGMGGIGRVLASKLHSDYGLQVLLLGRSALNAAAQEFLAANPGLTYAQVDISDASSLQSVVAHHERLWQRPLCGVVHLAGSGGWRKQLSQLASHRFTGLTSTSYDDQFSAAIEGTSNLFELVKTRPTARFVASSSVLGIFGGASFSVYAAAKSFLHAFCRAQYQAGHKATTCLHWSPWLDTGMSTGQAPEQALSAGYLSLTPEAGWHTFVASLFNDQHDLVIGLDPTHARDHLAKHITILYTTEQAGQAAHELAALSGMLRLAPNCTLDFRRVPEIPADSSALLEEPVKGLDAPEQEAYQKKLSLIFEQALHLNKVPLDDNLFELGAHSLLLATLEARIKQEVSESLELVDLFRFPTIRQLARHLAGLNSAAGTPAVDQRKTQAVNRTELRNARNKHRKGLS